MVTAPEKMDRQTQPQAEGTLPDVFAFFAQEKSQKHPMARLFGAVPRVGDKSRLQGRVADMSTLQTGKSGAAWVDFIVRAFLGDEDGYHNFRCLASGALARSAHLVFPLNATVVVFGEWTITKRAEGASAKKIERKTLWVRRGYDLKTRQTE